MIKELENSIRERAHLIWEREGRPADRAAAHWDMAAAEIAAEAAPAAAKPKATKAPRAAAAAKASTPRVTKTAKTPADGKPAKAPSRARRRRPDGRPQGQAALTCAFPGRTGPGPIRLAKKTVPAMGVS